MNHFRARVKIENAAIQIISDATTANVYQSDGAVTMITVIDCMRNYVNLVQNEGHS